MDSKTDHRGSRKHNRQKHSIRVYFILLWESLTDMKSLSLLCSSRKTFPKSMLKSNFFFIFQEKMHRFFYSLFYVLNIIERMYLKRVQANKKQQKKPQKTQFLICASYLNKRRFEFNVYIYYLILYLAEIWNPSWLKILTF